MVRRAILTAALMAACLTSWSVAAQTIVGDGIPAPLAGPGDAARGRAIIIDRQKGFCLLCHSAPFPEQRFMGNLAPSIAGAGARYSEAQLRLRIAMPSHLNPDTLMPSYFRTEGLHYVAKAYVGKPILDGQQIEDVVAFLMTLKEPSP